MNWYKILKFSQIWSENHSPYRPGFADDLYFLYESEYKYSMLSQYPERFKGNPQRRANILEQFEDNIRFLIDEIATPIHTTFERWLDKHAILDPGSWADERLEDALNSTNNCQEVVGWIEGEASRYFGDFANTISRNIDDYPNIQRFFRDIKQDFYQMELEDLEYTDETYQTLDSLQQEEYAKKKLQHMEDMTFAEYLDNYIGVSGNASFFEWISGSCEYAGDGILHDLYKVLFIFWYEKWSAEGIDETRESIEKIYQQLENIEQFPIKQAIIVINSAIGAAHQTGDMLDYLSDDIDESSDEIRQLMTSLTLLSPEEKGVWDADLRKIRFQI